MIFNLKKFIHSLGFAFCGIKVIAKEEQNFRIQIVIAVLVTIAIFYFKISIIETIVVFTLIFLVLMAELINSLFERILDLVHPLPEDKVKKIKDMSSGIVFLCCLVSTIIGILIFFPYL
jgi:diacylglycerol kinase